MQYKRATTTEYSFVWIFADSRRRSMLNYAGEYYDGCQSALIVNRRRGAAVKSCLERLTMTCYGSAIAQYAPLQLGYDGTEPFRSRANLLPGAKAAISHFSPVTVRLLFNDGIEM